MALKEIIGQEKAKRVLKGLISNDRVPHAMLFTGEEGIGKKLTSINFAKALNCLEPESGDACDACQSCIRIDKNIHTDVTLVADEEDSGQIKISTVRRLQESLSYKPFEGRWKVIIVDNAENLNPSAANAFLETLEEPSSMSILLLISSRPEMILATIRSRCQKVIFSPLPVGEMEVLLLKKDARLSEEELLLLSALSGGRLGYAVNEDLIAQKDALFEKFLLMLESPDKDLWSGRDEMSEWFDWCQLWLRDIAVFNVTEMDDLLINIDKKKEISDISKKTSLKNIIKLSHMIDDIKGSLRFNLNIPITIYHTSMLMKKFLGRMNV
jgi:DNA polymerase-3 subunit delta'